MFIRFWSIISFVLNRLYRLSRPLLNDEILFIIRRGVTYGWTQYVKNFFLSTMALKKSATYFSWAVLSLRLWPTWNEKCAQRRPSYVCSFRNAAVYLQKKTAVAMLEQWAQLWASLAAAVLFSERLYIMNLIFKQRGRTWRNPWFFDAMRSLSLLWVVVETNAPRAGMREKSASSFVVVTVARCTELSLMGKTELKLMGVSLME